MRVLTLLLLGSLVLSGCASTSVKHSFPDVPPKLMDKPVNLKTFRTDDVELPAKEDSKVVLSVMTKMVAENYTTCNNYKEQILGLQSWISAQKTLNP